MKNRIIAGTITVFIFSLLTGCASQVSNAESTEVSRKEPTTPENTTLPWRSMNGPSGGRILEIAEDPKNPDRLWAAGIPYGIYHSTDRGLTWSLLPFEDVSGCRMIRSDPRNSGVLYSDYWGFSRSDDGGETWEWKGDPWGSYSDLRCVLVSQQVPGTVYIGVLSRDNGDADLFVSSDRGDSWESKYGPWKRKEAVLAHIAESDDALFIGVNIEDSNGDTRGLLYVSRNGGTSWEEIDYRGQPDLFVYSIRVNPHDPDDIWVSQGSPFNMGTGKPQIFHSSDSGLSWTHAVIGDYPHDSTQVRVIGMGQEGRIYVACGGDLLVTRDSGNTFIPITPSTDDFVGVDYRDILIDSRNPNHLLLPLRASGIAYSTNGGRTWESRHEGIIATSVNLLAARKNGTIFTSTLGEGTFRTTDEGESWLRLDGGGIIHPFGDELAVDPHTEETIWFAGDVPYIFRSDDDGDSWDMRLNPYRGGEFNFGSITSMTVADDGTVFALNDGFGIYRMDEPWQQWRFLYDSEVDYSYSLVAESGSSSRLWSGHSKKPFEKASRIRFSDDGGDHWSTALEVDGADAITSVVPTAGRQPLVWAASVGEEGGKVWLSRNGGTDWENPAPDFSFLTIHTAALAGDTAFLGAWGGGSWRSRDGGESWQELDDPRLLSAAAISVHPGNPRRILIADRSSPRLYETIDGGENWKTVYKGDRQAYRILDVAVDPFSSDRAFVATLNPGHAGMSGRLYRLIDIGGSTDSEDITGDLPRAVLAVTTDPHVRGSLYAVLHGSGVYHSDDGGDSWQAIDGKNRGLPDLGFSRLIVHPENPDRLWLVGGCDVRPQDASSAGLDVDVIQVLYESRDGGNSWFITPGLGGAGGGVFKTLAFGPDDVVVAAAEESLWISTDNGAGWSKVTDVPYTPIAGAMVDGDSRLYLYTLGGGAYVGKIRRSGRVDWTGQGLPHVPVRFSEIVESPDHRTVYATAYPGGVFRSRNLGATWQEINFGLPSFAVDDPQRQGYYDLAISESDPEILYLGLYGMGVYRSSNAGDTWYPVPGRRGEMAGADVTAMVVDPVDSDRLWVAVSGKGVLRTDDGGSNWSSRSVGLPDVDIRCLTMAPGGRVLAGTVGYSIYAFERGTWEPLHAFGNWGLFWPIWDDRPLYQYTSLLPHAAVPGKWMMGTFPQGVFVSEDDGATWHERNIGWTRDGCFRLVSHPEDPDYVFAGTYNGINRSRNFGEQWELADEGWPAEQWVFSIDFSSRNPDVMAACSKNGANEGRGEPENRGIVMRSDDGGDTWYPIMNGLDPNQEFYEILFDPGNPDVLYLAAQYQGMMISVDGGSSWHDWNEGLSGLKPATNGNNVTRCLIFSADRESLLFGTNGAGVYLRSLYRD